MIRYLFFILFLLHQSTGVAQTDDFISNILTKGSPLIQRVTNALDTYEVQIIYTAINRDDKDSIHLQSHSYNLDVDRYFYPASTVKMPVAFFALEKLNEVNRPDVHETTPMLFGASRIPQKTKYNDTTALHNQLTLAHLIKKVFLVSDNEAYNLLYSFCGQAYINDRLHQHGYISDKITHRVGAPQYTLDDNRYSNPYLFYSNKDILLIREPQQCGYSFDHIQKSNCKKGVGYYQTGTLINEPFNFCSKNSISLKSLHDILAKLVLPGAFSPELRYNITSKQRHMLLSFMGARPSESKYPTYNKLKYPDNYVKFLMVGDLEMNMPGSLRIFNKVGYAYGYLTDVAYISDVKTGVEFFLAATIHVNANAIYNDNVYEYEEIGIPFLAELGRLFYEHELTRNHSFDFKEIKSLNYD